MTELLAVPGWNTPETTLPTWVDSLRAHGLTVEAMDESPGVSWIVSTAVRLRGYAVMKGTVVEAINFEFDASDPAEARGLVESAAAAIGWEVHEDEDEDDSSSDD